MALTKEEQLLELRVTGLAEIQKAKEAIAAQEKQLLLYHEALQAGVISQTKYEQQVIMTAAATKHYSATIEAHQKHTRDYSQNMMALGYVFNDFFSVTGGIQQRLNAIANNMPMLLAGFGALGGVLGALLPVIGMLGPALWAAMKEWNGSVDHGMSLIDDLKEKIKELEKNPAKLAVDMRRLEDAKEMLDKLQAGIAEFKRVEAERPATEKEAGGVVAEIIREEVGGERATATLREQFTAEKTRGDVTLTRLENEAPQVLAEAQTAEAKARAFVGSDPGTLAARAGEEAVARAKRSRLKDIEQERQKRQIAINDDAEAAGGDLLKRAREGDPLAIEELGNRIEAAGLSETEGGQDSILMEAGANIRNARSNLEIKRKDKIARENWEKEKAEASAAETKRAADEAEQVQRNEADAAQVIAEDRAKQSGIEATRAKHDAQGRTERQRRIKEQVDAASGTELGEQATAAAGIYRAQGGYTDERGRKHKLDEPAQVADLMSQLEKRLQAMNPKADKGETREAALAMANRAFATVDAGKAAGESGAGIASDAVAKYMETIQRTNAEQAAELQRVNALFGSGAAAAEQQRMMMENRFRAQQVQSFSYLGGAW